jgi:hypothetical protein
MVAEAEVRLDVEAVIADNEVAVVVASVLVPSTVNVPLEVSEDVAVIAPPVMILLERVVMYAVTALKSVAKRLVVVLF